MKNRIKTFVFSNSLKAADRLPLEQFHHRREFEVYLINESIEPGERLLDTLKEILRTKVDDTDEIVLLSNPFHVFTDEYSLQLLVDCIKEANNLGADMLSGGVTLFTNVLRVSERLLWIDGFYDLGFLIIFKRYFCTIEQIEFDGTDKLVFLTKSEKKFLIYPFVSTSNEILQKENGDANQPAISKHEIYNETTFTIQKLINVAVAYKKIRPSQATKKRIQAMIARPRSIPTYVINLPERTDRKAHILAQFNSKEEFDLEIVEASRHKIGAVGLWQSIRKIIKSAKEEKHDVIIICEDDHEFTAEYSKDILFKNIYEGHEQGVDYMLGGVAVFRHVVPVSTTRLWVDVCTSTQFTIIYNKFFDKLLNADFKNDDVADLFMSELTINIMLLYPFMSVQKSFGYSDVTQAHNDNSVLLTQLFKRSDQIIRRIQQAYVKFAHG
ncbi:MAG: hypothetical protein QM768_17005 [Agriterribacter sp.]